MDNGISIGDLFAAMNNNRDDGLFGGGCGGILALIIIFVLLFGAGGWSNRGNDATMQGQIATQADIQRGFDTNEITRKLDGLANGLCDASYALNNTILQGLNANNIAQMQGFNTVGAGIANLGYQQQSCCCEINRNIDALRYENAKNTCDIITAGNANTQRIIDTMTNNTIQELRDNLQAAQLQLGNLAQTSTIIEAVRPFPSPAYITCSPYQSAQIAQVSGYGYSPCGNNYFNV